MNMNMKVNYKFQNNTFCANPLYSINLHQKVGKNLKRTVAATFAELNPSDKIDSEALKKIADVWEGGTSLARDIWYDFIYKKKDMKYFATILNKPKATLANRILSVISLENLNSHKAKTGVTIEFLQSSPNILGRLKGAGELAIYGTVRLAKANNSPRVVLTSLPEANSFYKKIGFLEVDNDIIYDYKLSRKKYNEFLSRVEKKYSFQPKVNS